jgi:hypothetical protein
MTTEKVANPQLLALSTLLQLEKDARHAESQAMLSFLIVNDTYRLCPYDQAILCFIQPSGKVKIVSVSGVSTIDTNAPMIRWLNKLIRHHLKNGDNAREIKILQSDNLPSSLQKGWKTWSQGQALWCPFIHPQKGFMEAGLLLFRKRSWLEAEMTLLNYLTDAYAHSLYAFKRKSSWSLIRLIIPLLILLGILATLFVSVHESVLAPAEIIAQSPLIVTAPTDGTIKNIYVKPNQVVKVGQKLFSLDETLQKNRYLITQKTLAVAKADLLRAEQKSFFDIKSQAELALLRTKVEQRQAELKYIAEILNKLEIKAEQAGIAIFADKNDWLGKPVVVGEKVMILANPKLTEVQLWVSVSDAINLEPNAKVQLFLNTDPTHPLAAHLYQSSYEAELTPDGWLAFRAKATFNNQESLPRIGLKGTGKIYGKKVKLYYYLFRRPWASVRQFLGL